MRNTSFTKHTYDKTKRTKIACEQTLPITNFNTRIKYGQQYSRKCAIIVGDWRNRLFSSEAILIIPNDAFLTK